MKRAARGSLKCRTQKNRQKVAIWAASRSFVGLYVFATIGTYRQSEKKLVKQQYLFHMSSQYG